MIYSVCYEVTMQNYCVQSTFRWHAHVPNPTFVLVAVLDMMAPYSFIILYKAVLLLISLSQNIVVRKTTNETHNDVTFCGVLVHFVTYHNTFSLPPLSRDNRHYKP